MFTEAGIRSFPQRAAPVDSGFIRVSSATLYIRAGFSPRDAALDPNGTRPSQAAIDQIVAACNGDLRGALRALLLVNEQLEAELQQFYAAATRDEMARGGQLLH